VNQHFLAVAELALQLDDLSREDASLTFERR
jgi:hypothetical protein